MKNSKLLVPLLIISTLIVAPIVALSANQEAARKTNQYMDDAVITTKVKSAIMSDAGLKAFDINVKTYHGKVQLSGFVDTQETADAAVKRAEAVEGVESVVNSLLVK